DRGEPVPHARKEKPRSEATRMRGFFRNTPAPQESAGLGVGTKGRRSLQRCPHFKCHIESDDCLLDPRLIDPSFSLQCPAPPLAWPPPCDLTTSAGVRPVLGCGSQPF